MIFDAVKCLANKYRIWKLDHPKSCVRPTLNHSRTNVMPLPLYDIWTTPIKTGPFDDVDVVYIGVMASNILIHDIKWLLQNTYDKNALYTPEWYFFANYDTYGSQS